MKGSGLTDYAVKLYRHLLDLCNEPDATGQWEEDGGKRRQYLDTCHELHTLLGRKPWQESVDDTIGCDVPPDWMVRQTPNRLADWASVREIRRALDGAVAAP